MSGFTDVGPGRTTIPTYRSRFERAVSSFDRCLETTPYEARPRTPESTARYAWKARLGAHAVGHGIRVMNEGEARSSP
jgi:hypothetical protein